ncbi:MAG: hypothetical protein O7A04_02150 [Acidobacteria bacterium]|nr:hypothetical protein [Acidobacteriota bacterium]
MPDATLAAQEAARAEHGMPAAVGARLAAGPLLPETGAGAAFSFARQKRLGGARRLDPQRAYRAARERLELLPRHSLGSSGRESRQAGGRRADVPLGWQSLGPGNIGGRTRALVIDPDRPRIMYMAGVSGGVWKTTHGGRSWQPLADDMANLTVNSLAMDPTDAETLYAGTGEGYFREAIRGTALPLRGAGIFKTTDGGATWEHLADTDRSAFRWVNDIVVSHNDPRRVYAATRRGVYRSVDGGLTWTPSLTTSVKGGCLDLVVRRDRPRDQLLASCGTLAQASVYRNTNAGGSGAWQKVLSEPGMGRTSLAIAPSRQRVVYALAASNVGGPGGQFQQGLHALFRSDAYGAPGSWRAQVRNDDPTKLHTLLLSNVVVDFVEECNFGGTNEVFNMGWYANVIAVDPIDEDRVWVGSVDWLRSDDAGVTWGIASYWWPGLGQSPSHVHADQHALVFHPRYNGTSNQTVFALNDGGIYRTNNALGSTAMGSSAPCAGFSGISWIQKNSDYEVTQFYHGSVLADGRSYLGGTQDNGTLRGSLASGSDDWVRILGGDGGYSVLDPAAPSSIIASTQGGIVWASTDGGLNFERSIDGIDDHLVDEAEGFRAVPSNFLFIAPLVGDPNQGSRLWLGGTRLWRSDERATSWRAASARTRGDKISAIAVAPGNSDIVLAGSDDGRIYRLDSATSASAETAMTSTRPRQGFVSSLAFHPDDETVVYATYAGFQGRHVWKSVDGGASWQSIDGSAELGLPDLPVHSIVVDAAGPGRLFIATDLGVLVSLDDGASWAVENTGFANVVTEWLTVSASGGRRHLFAFTHGRGVWRAPLD